jgi:SDR family mycofactocin-dependent oxidoreductase
MIAPEHERNSTVTDLAGRVAFITGVARGQGRSHALRLAQAGASVIGLDICEQVSSVDYAMSEPDDLRQTVELVKGVGQKMVGEVADVRDQEQIRKVYERGLEVFGRIDYVICNAGIMPIWGRYADTKQAWSDSLDVILTGVLNTIEVAYPHLVDQGTGGSIVVTGSMAGVQPSMRTVSGKTLGMLGYAAAKAALVNLAENYASILATYGIRVNVIHPTAVATPMIENDMVRARFESIDPQDALALVNALDVQWVEPVDISNTVLWLCSEASRYITGSAIRVDAGASLR